MAAQLVPNVRHTLPATLLHQLRDFGLSPGPADTTVTPASNFLPTVTITNLSAYDEPLPWNDCIPN